MNDVNDKLTAYIVDEHGDCQIATNGYVILDYGNDYQRYEYLHQSYWPSNPRDVSLDDLIKMTVTGAKWRAQTYLNSDDYRSNVFVVQHSDAYRMDDPDNTYLMVTVATAHLITDRVTAVKCAGDRWVWDVANGEYVE